MTSTSISKASYTSRTSKRGTDVDDRTKDGTVRPDLRLREQVVCGGSEGAKEAGTHAEDEHVLARPCLGPRRNGRASVRLL